MIWCAIVLAIALLTGRPVVLPACWVPPEPVVAERVKVVPAPSPTRRPTARPGARFMGLATWYRWHSGEAAAGPALRRAIGDWRGRSVVVISGTTRIVVRLTDWCACPGGRIVDLDRASFTRLADPSRGVIPVSVEVVP